MTSAAPVPPPIPAGPDRRVMAFACLLIAAGTGWLLGELSLFPRVDWVWIFGLFVFGGLVFLFSGAVDKFSIVVGPLFMAAAVLSLIRQVGWIDFALEMPAFVIISGVLLLIAQAPQIPTPTWYAPPVRRE